SISMSGGTLTALGVTNHGDINQSGGVATMGTLDGTGALTSSGSGQLTTGYVRQAVVNSASFGKVNIVPNGTSASVSRVGALNMTGGTFDLADNDMVLDITPLP